MSTYPALIYEPLFEDVVEPRRATQWSAGYDVHAYIKGRTIAVFRNNDGAFRLISRDAPGGFLILEPGERAIIPLGFKARLPLDHEAQIRPRSGRSIKTALRIPNAPGTIDADFPNEWAVLVENTSATHDEVIRHGEAIAQCVFARYEVLELELGTVGRVTDRSGGYGSTDGQDASNGNR